MDFEENNEKIEYEILKDINNKLTDFNKNYQEEKADDEVR